MKKAQAKRPRASGVREDDPLPEHDFSHGVRGKYAAELPKSTTLVLLDSDVAEFFPDAASVNDALRAIAAIAQRHTTPAGKKRPNRSVTTRRRRST